MSETLGSLCDKLIIVKLKQYHSDDPNRLKSLSSQESQLCNEMDIFILLAIKGEIPIDKLTFSSNKVYPVKGNEINEINGNIGTIFSELAKVNCELWHEQEKVYDFERVHPDEKNHVVKQLAVLNLQRNKCIDEIDKQFQMMILKKS